MTSSATPPSKTELVVIGAGWGRTGTTSLKVALEELLGGKVHHMREVYMHKDIRHHLELWERESRGERVNLEELFEGFVGAVDWPSCNIYKELSEHWPNAKVILTVREPAAWQKSVLDTIYTSRYLLNESAGRFLTPINRLLMPGVVRHMEWVNQYIWHRCFFSHAPEVRSLHGKEGLALIEKRMAEWVAEVKATIPADKLLVFRVEEGWEPLCKFLGKPVPEHAFPRVNETADFQKMVRKRKMMWYGLPVVFLGAVGATVWAANKWLR